jgi:hypothetical protein
VKIRTTILSFILALGISPTYAFYQQNIQQIRFDFYGDTISFAYDRSNFVEFSDRLSFESINAFYQKMKARDNSTLLSALLSYKRSRNPDDWLYYQLIRKTAQQLSPKGDNYHRYTLYKWFFLTSSGYDATLTIADDRLLFYVQSDENIYNIPYRIRNGKQYVCLNYHDYGNNIDFEKIQFSEVAIPITGATRGFSYKVKQLPDFHPGDYLEKDLRFNYNQNDYYFKVKLNPQIKNIFANYPVVDYESYFNIPLSGETYRSLIPLLKKNIKGMNPRNGIDYLMRFTRYAFLFETDLEHFGAEKRLSPEQTLLYEQSDCEDRAALFFYLVKEIYNVPMIVLAFQDHVTVAVKLAKPVGSPIIYNGEKYTICEPTPQKFNLAIGELPPQLKKAKFEIVYVYKPEIIK